MKRASIAIIILVSIFGALLYFSGRNSEAADIAAAKQQFMSTCNVYGNQTEYCSCTFDSLISKLGLDGVIKVSLKYNQDNVIPDEMYAAAASCFSKIKEN
jgi:hypothetical protein